MSRSFTDHQLNILVESTEGLHLNGKIDAAPKTAETILSRADAAFRTLDFLYHNRIVDVIIEDDEKSAVVQIKIAGRSEPITTWVTIDDYRIEGIKGSAKTAIMQQLDMALKGYRLVPMHSKETGTPLQEPANEMNGFVHQERPLEFLPCSAATFDED